MLFTNELMKHYFVECAGNSKRPRANFVEIRRTRELENSNGGNHGNWSVLTDLLLRKE